jgi:hypothetical protein
MDRKVEGKVLRWNREVDGRMLEVVLNERRLMTTEMVRLHRTEVGLGSDRRRSHESSRRLLNGFNGSSDGRRR